MADNERVMLRLDNLLAVSRAASIQTLCLPHALEPQILVQLGGSLTRMQGLKRGESLFHQGNGLHALYMVAEGLIKTIISDNTGREQVVGFHFPSELVGLDALHDREHVCSALAMDQSKVRVIPIHRLQETLQQSPGLFEALEKLFSKTLAEHEQLLLVVNQYRATKRVAIFLFSLTCRLSKGHNLAWNLPFNIPRGDIANYLNMAPETLSRVLGELQEDGILETDGRRILIMDPMRLTRLATSGSEPGT